MTFATCPFSVSLKTMRTAKQTAVTWTRWFPIHWFSIFFLFCFTLTGCGFFGGGNGEDTTPPDVPSGLSATSQDGAVALDWNSVPSDDLAGYTVYRSTTTGVDASGSSLESGVSAAEYVDETAENGTTYYYVVTAVDEADNESGPSGEVEKTPFSGPPDRP